MGQNKSEVTFKPRKATFTVEVKKGKRVFTAVNRRGHKVAQKAGKRSKVTLEQLRALKNTGSYKYYFYSAEGKLKPIRL